jgi:twitching motility protein PilJ
MQALADGTGAIDETAERLGDDVDYLGGALAALAQFEAVAGDPQGLVSALENATGAQARVADTVRATIASADEIAAAHDARARLGARVGELTQAVSRAASVPVRSVETSLVPFWVPIALLAVALLALGALAVIHAATADLRRKAEKQARQNERNQEAILRLLDELSNLADGDLTVQATVTEDITGAIADSINYAIEALRELVTTINDTAITLDASTRQTQATAGHLAKASVAQSKQVASATESMAAMATSVEEVSGNAERAADVARHSVDIAHKGGDAVRRTIDGMNTIRETIQETSKRIKRLGESSQEIGNIVELINDIAEQTNILALNASIQASMAGEAGRGFAVVADEVQRLAERAANATKQIEVLVRTIQADTNEAVVSMERSTTDVVGGALLAENAGAALEEIEKVSNQIASLVQNISGSARQQAASAGNISRNMQVLREISSQTADNTSATSTSIGKLAELATQLRKSVSGFRLPGSEAGPDAPDAGAVPLRPERPREQRKISGIA